MTLLFHKESLMYFRLLMTVTVVLSVASVARAQAWGSESGAGASGMNGCSVAVSGFWNVNNNPAGITDFTHYLIGINYADRFSMKELSTKSLAGIIPVHRDVMAFSFNYFGYAIYHEMKTGLVYARKLSPKLSAGVQLDYLSVTYGEGFGTASRVTFGLGLQYHVSKNLVLGAYVYNPVHAAQSASEQFVVPFIIRAGLAYHFSQHVLTTVEVDHNSLVSPWNVKAGVEYKTDNRLFFQTGVGLYQDVFSFGVGYEWHHFTFDVASSFHQQLGLSPQFSLIYAFQR